MLVHMTPDEVAGLQALAQQMGGSLTINPQTGLPEANIFKKLLPMALALHLALLVLVFFISIKCWSSGRRRLHTGYR
jgi:hypothetical protein